jgi:hypothetical protein
MERSTQTDDRTALEHHDPRDDTLLVGIDTDSCHHVLKTEQATDTLLVVEGTDVVWRQDNVDADKWADHIAERRQWDSRRLGAFDEVYTDELVSLREAI